MSAVLVWFRNDLRLSDHPALDAALSQGKSVVPVFIWSPDDDHSWPPGSATRWWLQHSLLSLQEELRHRGSRLILRTGSPLRELRKLLSETDADTVYWNRCYEPSAIARDTTVKQKLRDDGVTVESFPGNLLHEPWTVVTQQGLPFQVFTPFWKACQSRTVAEPIPSDTLQFPALRTWPTSTTLESLGLLPRIDWAAGFRSRWSPGRTGAETALERFLETTVNAYHERRDIPAIAGTSLLSPHLHFGEISPREIWHRVHARNGANASSLNEGASTFLKELGWREFAHHILFHFPHVVERPLREKFLKFPWDNDQEKFRAWTKGKTGYPIVDAGMRELWSTGWMHNRVRMIVGSFLTKHLLISWERGARWFWETLVDADLASNTLGWQWISGCGPDAAPYFRIFNPVMQGENFDPAGEYVKRWVPELRSLPTKWIHHPWDAPADMLSTANIKLGETYSLPIVDHREARARALAAIEVVKGGE